MLEEINWCINDNITDYENYLIAEKMYLCVPINREQTLALHLTIIKPTLKKVLNRIYRFYDSKIDEKLRERMGLVGEKWRDVMGENVRFGGICHKGLDIYELVLI